MNEKSDFMEVAKMMPTIGIMTIVSAALTIYLCHDEYKNGKMSSKNFKIVAICEGFAILGMILSILVDTFISKISFPMQPGPEIGSISDA